MKRWFRSAIISGDATLSRLPVAQRIELVQAMERQHRLLVSCLPAVVAVPIGLGATGILVLIASSCDLSSPVEILIGVAAVYGGGIAALIATGGEIYRAALRRMLRKYITQRLCIWCGYSLMGRASASRSLPLIICPECGRDSAVATPCPDE
jgi:uncharacterized membrane protein